jgi:sortase (surface protein transpeptidase)
MRKILILLLVCGSIVSASNKSKENSISKKQLEMQMKKEKKYAKEQKFYQAHEYDLSGAEVNPESVKALKPIEVDNMDMDDVYD